MPNMEHKPARAAAEALTEIGEPAVEPLIAVLQDSEEYINLRSNAAFVLGEIGDARAVKPLIEASREASSGQYSGGTREYNWYTDLYNFAVEALSKIDDPDAVELLTAAREDDDGTIRQAAAAALQRLESMAD